MEDFFLYVGKTPVMNTEFKMVERLVPISLETVFKTDGRHGS